MNQERLAELENILGLPKSPEELLKRRIAQLEAQIDEMNNELNAAQKNEYTSAAQYLFHDTLQSLQWNEESRILIIEPVGGPKRFLRIHLDNLDDDLAVEWGWNDYDSHVLWRGKKQN